MAGSLSRRCAAGSAGTALLIVSGPGAVVAALTVGKSLDYAALSVVGFSFGLVVAIVIYAFGTTPGAHIHPAVTVWLAGSGQAVSSAACSSSGPPSVRKPWPACSVGPSPDPTHLPAYVVGSMLGGVAAALSQDLIARETPRRWTSRPRAPKMTWSDPTSDRARAARNRTGGSSRKR